MNPKTFDCVEMKRQSAAKIHEEIKDFTFDEKVAYWEKRNRLFMENVARREVHLKKPTKG